MRFGRTRVLYYLLVLLVPTFSHGADREVFLYGEAPNTGALIHDYGSRWIEFVGTQEKFSFDELSRTDETLELLDRRRDVGLKVHRDHGELRLMKSTTWQPWQQGRWVPRQELPPTIRFAPTDNQIRLVYFVPSDREPTAHYEQKIRVVMDVVNDLYQAALRPHGYQFDALSVEQNAERQPVVHLVRTGKPARHYNGGPAYNDVQHFLRIYEDLPPEVGSVRRHVIVAFAETYDPGPAPIEWNGSVGRGTQVSADGGLGVMSAWILRDEFCATDFAKQQKLILDATPIRDRTALGTRQPHSPRFEFIEDGFGAVAHELGHALGLPHDYRDNSDMMGHGFRSLQGNYRPAGMRSPVTFSRDNGRLLRVSRHLFQDVDRTDNTPPAGDVTAMLTPGVPRTLAVTVTATDDRRLSAVTLFDSQIECVVGGAELSGTRQIYEVTLPVRTARTGEYRLTALVADHGGNITQATATVKIP